MANAGFVSNIGHRPILTRPGQTAELLGRTLRLVDSSILKPSAPTAVTLFV